MQCNYCHKNSLNIIFSNKLSVGLCSECNLKQLVSFEHIDLSLYTSLSNLPNDFKEERIRQEIWNKDRMSILKEYFQNLNNNSVIDYGAGSGGFLEAGKKYFKDIHGYDICEKACKNNNDDGLVCYNDLSDLNHNYDIITFFHVLEHVKNPVEFLKSSISKIKNVKHVVIEVPNTNEALMKLYNNLNYSYNHYCIDHLWYFTEDTLKNVLTDAGLNIQLITQIQRYPLQNHLKWITGIHEKNFGIFNELNENYKNILIDNSLADSLFFICKT